MSATHSKSTTFQLPVHTQTHSEKQCLTQTDADTNTIKGKVEITTAASGIIGAEGRSSNPIQALVFGGNYLGHISQMT